MRRYGWLMTIVLAVGCSQAKIQPDNLRLTASLRTALSTKNGEWLQQNVDAIEARRAEGQMNDDEYEAFQAIVAQAKEGEWEAAERAAVRLQKAQRPTPDQLERLPKVAKQ